MKNKTSILWIFAFMLISNISFGQCPHIEEVRLWDNSWSNPLSSGPSQNNYTDFSTNDCIPLFDTPQPQINIAASQGGVYMAMYADLDGDGLFETQIFNFYDANGLTGVNASSTLQPGTAIRIIVSVDPITTGDERPNCGEMEEYVICEEDPCEECFNFFGIEVIDADDCDYEFVMDYAATGNCGAISIVSEDWDFGYAGGTGSGYYTTHSFPGNGTYTVTATIVYTTASGLTCTAVETTQVTVTGCVDPCEDCFNFFGIEVLDSRACDYEFVMDYAATGKCGAISIVSEDWDFGYAGGTGSGYYTTHSFPGNGVYTVTATIVYTTATGATCTAVQTLDIAVNGCNDCECVNGGEIQTWNSNDCSIGFWLGGFGIDGCATLQPGYTWDFGDGNGGVTANNYTYHTYTNPGTYFVTVSFVVVNNKTGQPCTQTYSLIIKVDECGKEGKSMSIETPPMDVDTYSVNAFPNPSEDLVTFSVESSIESIDGFEQPELVVYDQIGREVHRSSFENSSEKVVDFQSIGSGFYIYRIIQDGQTLGSGELMIK